MASLWDLVNAFATPFMQHPQIVLMLAILIVGWDAGIFGGGNTCSAIDGSNMTYEQVKQIYPAQISYESAVANPNLVVKRALAGWYVVPVVFDTGFLIPDSAFGFSLDPAVYISSPNCEPYDYVIFAYSDGSSSPNLIGQLFTGLLGYMNIPVVVHSFWLFVLMILSSVGFWALTSLARS